MLEQERANCSQKVQSMKCSKMSCNAEELRVPFIGTKGLSIAREKQPHTIISLLTNFALGTMQSDKELSPGNHRTQDLSIGMPEGESWLVTLGNMSPLLYCSDSSLYTTESHALGFLLTMVL